MPPRPRTAQKTNSLDFSVDPLEQRMMLAADVQVAGSNVKIIGENTADDISVYFDEATNSVWVNDGVALHDTLLESISRLTISTKQSGNGTDVVTIGNRVEVTTKTTVRLGAGRNELSFGGLHKLVSVSGGPGSDAVTLNGGLGTSKNNFNLKNGDDALTIAIDAYAASATGDTPLANFLATLPDDITVLSELAAIRSNLGGGDDVFRVLYGGESVTEPQLLETLESLGLGSYTTVSDAINGLESAAAAAGIRNLRLANLNGAGGNDTMLPGSFAAIIDFLGSQKRFETFVDPPVVDVSLANDTAAFGQTNSDGLTYDATMTGTVVGAATLVASVDENSTTNVALADDGSFVFDPGFATDGTSDGFHLVESVASRIRSFFDMSLC